MTITVQLIRWWRKQRKLTQAEIGEAADVTRQAVGEWESGRAAPTIDGLEAIVKKLKLTLARFYGAERYL